MTDVDYSNDFAITANHLKEADILHKLEQVAIASRLYINDSKNCYSI